MIETQIYLALATLLLAGKDATSYLLKDKNSTNGLELKRIKRWHRDGVALALLFIVQFIYNDPSNWWKYLTYALLIRLILFDPFFNKWSKLNVKYLGSTALFDRLFSKIFGNFGALYKSLTFTIILIILNFIIK